MAEAHGQERLLACQQPVDGAARSVRDLGVVVVARVARPGPDDHQVGGVEDGPSA